LPIPSPGLTAILGFLNIFFAFIFDVSRFIFVEDEFYK